MLRFLSILLFSTLTLAAEPAKHKATWLDMHASEPIGGVIMIR